MLVQISSVHLIAENTTIPIFADVPRRQHKRMLESHLKKMVVLLKKVKADELALLTEIQLKQKTAEQVESAGGTNGKPI